MTFLGGYFDHTFKNISTCILMRIDRSQLVNASLDSVGANFFMFVHKAIIGIQIFLKKYLHHGFKILLDPLESAE